MDYMDCMDDKISQARDDVQSIFLVKNNLDIVGDDRNKMFRWVYNDDDDDDEIFGQDNYAMDSPRSSSDLEQPRAVLRITTSHVPKDPEQGFLFGRDPTACDILLDYPFVSKKQFCIQADQRYNTIFLKNLSCSGTCVRLMKTGVSVRLMKSRLNLGDYESTEVDLGENNKFEIHRCYDPIRWMHYCARLRQLPALRQVTLAQIPEQISRPPRFYLRGPLLHEGTKAQLFTVYEKNSKQRLVMKVYHKPEHTGWQEAKILERLKHRNIVRFVAYKTSSHSPEELIMEYADGPTLEEVLDDDQPLRADEIQDILLQLLEAVAYMEDEGITHHNLKLSNVILAQRDPTTIKLVDFNEATDKTRINSYSSPTSSIVDRPDMFAVGLMAHELLLGQSPSSPAADLLNWLLCEDPARRPSAREAIGHVYFGSMATPDDAWTDSTTPAYESSIEPMLPEQTSLRTESTEAPVVHKLWRGYLRLEWNGKRIAYRPRQGSLNVTHLVAGTISRAQLRHYFKTHPKVAKTRVWWRHNVSGTFMSIDGDDILSLCEYFGLDVVAIRSFLAEVSSLPRIV